MVMLCAQRLLIACVFFATLSSSPGFAQSPAQQASHAIACVSEHNRELTRQIQLMREARDQLRASDAEIRQAAEQMIISIQQRMNELAEAIQACVPESAQLRTETRVETPQGTAAAVAQENEATEVVERDQRISSAVQARVGQRVDGRGTIPASRVRSMVRTMGPGLDRCYDQLVDRGALVQGELIVAFTVTFNGRIDRVTIEGQRIGDGRFANCVRREARGMAAAQPAAGDVRYAYTLRFGVD